MDELRKNQTYTVEIDGYSSSGAGVCRVNGRAVFVERALVNELWEILILKVTAATVHENDFVQGDRRRIRNKSGFSGSVCLQWVGKRKKGRMNE